MSKFDGLYDIRDGKENDHKFVLATMLRGLYYGDSWFSLIPKDLFMDNYKKVVLGIINSPDTTLKVACLKEEPDVILGYSLLSSNFDTVFWVYVKSSWRNKGIAKRLTPSYPTYVAHLTTLGHKLLDKFPNVKFNPFARF